MWQTHALLGSNAAPTYASLQSRVIRQNAVSYVSRGLKRATHNKVAPQAAAQASEQVAAAATAAPGTGAFTVPATRKAWHIKNQVSSALNLLTFISCAIPQTALLSVNADLQRKAFVRILTPPGCGPPTTTLFVH
jgi:hypothetical protein